MSSHKGAATFLRAKGLCSQYVGVNLKKKTLYASGLRALIMQDKTVE